MRRHVLLILLLACFMPSVAAQEPELFTGPLVVTNTLQQDGLLIIAIEGGQQRLLQFGDGEHFIGDFSPDGCQLIFTWEHQPGHSDLFLVNLDGSGLRQLTFIDEPNASGYRVWDPSWSPDGERIVFTYMRYYTPLNQEARRTTHIAWVPASGGNPILYSNSGSEWQPRWSPDGQWLVYVSEQPVEGTEPAVVKPELWLVGADGNNKRRLTNYAEGAAFNPRWSPRGDRIAFIHESLEQRLMIMPFDGTASPTPVTAQEAMILDYTWRPTGQHLIAAIRGLEGENENILWQVPTQQNQSASPLIDTFYLDFPRYDASGRWLAFRDAYELAVYDSGRESIEHFGPDTRNNSPPVWSPADFRDEADCGRS